MKNIIQEQQDAERCRSVLKNLSKERVAPYEKIIPPHIVSDNRDMMLARTYVLFQSVPAMLFVPLHFLEVVLRNRIYEVLVELYSKKKAIVQDDAKNPNEWYLWMPLDKNTRKAIYDAEAKAEKEIKSRDIIPGDVISRLTFGNWINILEERPNPNDPFRFWNYAKLHVFPNSQCGKGDILKRLRDLNTVRNRLFHYEPLWNRQKSTDIADDLRKIMDTILETISWISQDCRDFLAVNMPLRASFNEICDKLKQRIS